MVQPPHVSQPTDARVVSARVGFFDERLRTPLVIATGRIEAVTRARVEVRVETADGRGASGVGEMILSDLWGFPSARVPHADRDRAMRLVTERFAQAAVDYGAPAHPIVLFDGLHETLDRLRREVSAELQLAETMPLLGALVCASATDLAVHDAFGHVHGVCSYNALGPEYCPDLSRWLGDRFRGRYLSDYLSARYEAQLPVLHLVGGGDKLSESEITAEDPRDGLPVSLDQWIRRDGVFCFKVKLKGTDLRGDLDRLVDVFQLASGELRQVGRTPRLTADTNEQCPDVEYPRELLVRLRERSADAFDSLVLFEQPTERDIGCHRYDMHAVSRLKPVLVDEGLTRLEDLDLGLELGWSGAALKICKGLSAALLVFARCKADGLCWSVQDLTLPGTSFVHSAGFAARVAPMIGVEYNSRQYLPNSCAEVRGRHPELFTVREGMISLGSVGSTGLGA